MSKKLSREDYAKLKKLEQERDDLITAYGFLTTPHGYYSDLEKKAFVRYMRKVDEDIMELRDDEEDPTIHNIIMKAINIGMDDCKSINLDEIETISQGIEIQIEKHYRIEIPNDCTIEPMEKEGNIKVIRVVKKEGK